MTDRILEVLRQQFTKALVNGVEDIVKDAVGKFSGDNEQAPVEQIIKNSKGFPGLDEGSEGDGAVCNQKKSASLTFSSEEGNDNTSEDPKSILLRTTSEPSIIFSSEKGNENPSEDSKSESSIIYSSEESNDNIHGSSKLDEGSFIDDNPWG